MQAPSDHELLEVWERGSRLPPVQRALALLATACPDAAPETLAHWSIGRRDEALLTLREWTFGPDLVGEAGCPQCAGRVELTFDISQIRTPQAAMPEACTLAVEDYELCFRLPDSFDLMAIATSATVSTGRAKLLELCLISARKEGEERRADQLPEEIVQAITNQMAQADPQAETQLRLECPFCGRQWQAIFDIASFFWSEIAAWARKVTREVHSLASAYGWREADILALSPWRRRLYLEMIGS